MKEVNFLEACEALMDGKCKEIENKNGNRYGMQGESGSIRHTSGDGIIISPDVFLGKWKLIGVKKKIVIEDVKWRIAESITIPFQDSMGLFGWGNLLNKPKMKMTLEWEE